MATSLLSSLKNEIGRLSRKVVKVEVSSLHTASTAHRRSIAGLRRQVASLEKEVRQLKKAIGRDRTFEPKASSEGESAHRFQARGLKSHRQRLDLSAADYGRLIGVSSLTVYNWESGKTKPRRSQLPAIAAVRGLGKREVATRLASTK